MRNIFELAAFLSWRMDLEIMGIRSEYGTANEVTANRIDIWNGEGYACWGQGFGWGVTWRPIVRDERDNVTWEEGIYLRLQQGLVKSLPLPQGLSLSQHQIRDDPTSSPL